MWKPTRKLFGEVKEREGNMIQHSSNDYGEEEPHLKICLICDIEREKWWKI